MPMKRLTIAAHTLDVWVAALDSRVCGAVEQAAATIQQPIAASPTLADERHRLWLTS